MDDCVSGERAGVPLRRERMRNDLRRYRWIYLMALVPFVYYVVFSYVPMYGIIIAFKDFKYNLGILGSPWVGLKYFQRMFSLPKFIQVLKNTLSISFLRLLVEFPFPILLALMLNEVRRPGLKRVLQTAYTFPNFVSWVVISGILVDFLETGGLVNRLLRSVGLPNQNILKDSGQFVGLLLGSGVWKSAGWGAIIYLSALSSVDPTLYEAAVIDGANRVQCLFHITLPSIASTIVVMLILSMGNVMNAGFDQIFNLYNATVLDRADILDTYVYRLAFNDGNFSYSTAVGIFKSVVNCTLLFTVNKIAHRLGQRGIY